jgi:hypothetical protein
MPPLDLLTIQWSASCAQADAPEVVHDRCQGKPAKWPRSCDFGCKHRDWRDSGNSPRLSPVVQICETRLWTRCLGWSGEIAVLDGKYPRPLFALFSHQHDTILLS